MSYHRFSLVLPALLLFAAGARAQTILVEHKDGDSLGFAALTKVTTKTISDHGAWVVAAHTDFADPDSESALLDNTGLIRLREGDPLPVPTIFGNLVAHF